MTDPYYQDDYVTLYHGDSLKLLDQLDFDVIVTDPPYGISVNTRGASTGRGSNGRTSSGNAVSPSRDYPPIHGDDKPFDPLPLLALNLPTVLFGANHYGSRLPDASRWLAWDKLDGLTSKRDIGFNDQADCELAWTNLGGPARLYSQRWMGAMKSGEDRMTARRHPTEKPVELMRWVLAQCPDGIVLDPFAGAGSTLRAAKDLGRQAIGIELEEQYCKTIVGRLAQEVLAI